MIFYFYAFSHLFRSSININFCMVVRVWNYEEATLLNSFDNHSYPDKGISKLCLVNELDESLLLVASSKTLFACFYIQDLLLMQYMINGSASCR